MSHQATELAGNGPLTKAAADLYFQRLGYALLRIGVLLPDLLTHLVFMDKALDEFCR